MALNQINGVVTKIAASVQDQVAGLNQVNSDVIRWIG